jgi:hypothetical protein
MAVAGPLQIQGVCVKRVFVHSRFRLVAVLDF